MGELHYKEELSAFVDSELDRDERQRIGEHLLVCEACRREHDEIKLAASLAVRLPAVDAPPNVWQNIQRTLDGRDAPQMGLIPDAAKFTWQKTFALAAAIGAVSILSVLVYLSLFSGERMTARQSQSPPPAAPVSVGQPESAGVEIPAALNTESPAPQPTTDANTADVNSIQAAPADPTWAVETVTGEPVIGGGSGAGKIAVGQMLETDGRSKARITVVDIGSVEVSPNSRVKLIGTSSAEHRLALERGRLHAKIFAPPRLFIVDTPTAKAVDLGCEYTLDVDPAGNSTLRVTSGFVALEDGGRESIVPAGMMCLTRKGKGLGTPFSPDADSEFRKALEQFDFGNGGSLAVRSLLAKAEFYDMVTLWHLLSRVGKEDRGPVFDRLAEFVSPPRGVTREGIIDLNKKMLDNWRTEVENLWFN